MPGSSSSTWKFFQLGEDESGMKIGTCKICNKLQKYTRNSTSTLWQHFLKEHMSEYDKVKNEKLRRGSVLMMERHWKF